VEAPGFEARRQLLRVYQPKVLRTVALPIARVEGPSYSSLTGTIRNYDGPMKNLRVRLIALYGNELQESMVDEQGSFSFPTDEGLYLFMVTADTDKGIAVVDSKPLRIGIGKKETITINLKGKHGDLLRK
jgi:hypothetical protein